jgi:3-methyladenine DNA glycosylase AlkD
MPNLPAIRPFTARQILDELKPLGRDSYKRILVNNHGVKEPCFGVPISELKKFQKRIRKDYQLALDLYDTGNYDAMYLAGLIADDARMSRNDLEHWVAEARGGALVGYTVPWVAAGSPHGMAAALDWIKSSKPLVAAAGWATLSSLVSVKADADLDLPELKSLLNHVQKTIFSAPDIVRYQMNGFLISVGCYVASLTELAIAIADKIGPVTANLGNNDCQVPFAPDYIRKVQARGSLGKKRKTAKC